jgi:hypothetical protein
LVGHAEVVVAASPVRWQLSQVIPAAEWREVFQSRSAAWATFCSSWQVTQGSRRRRRDRGDQATATAIQARIGSS